MHWLPILYAIGSLADSHPPAAAAACSRLTGCALRIDATVLALPQKDHKADSANAGSLPAAHTSISPQSTPTDGGPASLPSIDGVRVLTVRRSDDPKRRPVIAGIDERIELEVQGLKQLTLVSKCRSADNKQDVTGCKPHPITLFLAGREIKGLIPEGGAAEPTDSVGTVQFHLARSTASDETWADLLGSPTFDENFWTKGTAVSVGLEDGYALPTDVSANEFRLTRILVWRFWIALVMLAVLAGIIISEARRSDLLRDVGPSPTTGKKKPYSLARVQMAFWFYLTIGSFLFIWLITRATNTITTTVLALIGISSATFLGAATIDNGNPPKGAPPETKTFGKDILGDNDASFHRFQIAIWTLVLGWLFIVSVWSRLSMPTFEGTLLGLMGISSGTYVGFKLAEKP